MKLHPKSSSGSGIVACPCGSALPYARCCGRFHAGEAAPDVVALMRSRYCAYVLRLPDYLLATWAPDTRPTEPLFDESGGPKWIGLDVLRQDSDGDERARVEFVARYRIGGRARRMHEVSRFLRRDGRWYYVDGDVEQT
jgi:SEC-C motif domain protein